MTDSCPFCLESRFLETQFSGHLRQKLKGLSSQACWFPHKSNRTCYYRRSLTLLNGNLVTALRISSL